MTEEDMTHGSVVAIIMTTVLLMIVAAIVLGCNPAHGRRSCLDHNEAARTWPTRDLVRDRDGCWTYSRLKPPEPEPAIIFAPSTEEAEINTGLDMLQRWPTIVDLTPSKPRIVEAEPLLTVRSVVSVILVVVLTCAVFEVAFGGMTRRAK